MWPLSQLAAINLLSTILGRFFVADYSSTIVLRMEINVIEKNVMAESFEFSTDMIEAANALARNRFPDKFLFGVASSAYQIEGAYDTPGKGVSVWDFWSHTNLGKQLIKDGSNGDDACKSYYRYADDVQLIKNLGANVYRISLSWTRILPTGLSNAVSLEGIQYYNKLINTMILNGITPMVVIHHFDIPLKLQLLGGWTNPKMIEYFENYARVAYTYFGDRVKHWITINDPWELCNMQFGNAYQPFYEESGIGNYLCGHHALLAHARAYRVYRNEFQWIQNGKVGISVSTRWFEPEDYTSLEDVEAAEISHQFANYWFINPLLGDKGDYPDIMKIEVGIKSGLQRFKTSRLPSFTPEEIDMVKNSLDFLGITFYTTYDVRSEDSPHEGGPIRTTPLVDDMSAVWLAHGDAFGAFDVKNTAPNFGKLLQRLNEDYILPAVYITGNGYADFGESYDMDRTIYYHDHIGVLLETMKKGIDIRGYIAWSLMDSFEWYDGYSKHYGLYEVNFTDTLRSRKEKLSAKIIKNIYRSKVVPETLTTRI